jgi:tetratricopeptide (TPR) repeat protein
MKLPKQSLAALCLALAGAAEAAAPGDPFQVMEITRGEMARLPEYCPYTWAYHKGPPETQQVWYGRLGQVFAHMHHYCWGLLKAQRAERPGMERQTREALYTNAIQEVNYVLERAPENFVLRPELLYRAGQFAVGRDDPAQAIEFFEASIRSKADYWPAYLELSNVQLKIFRRQQAIEVLEAGLKVMPDDPRLIAALKRIHADKRLGLSPRQAAAKPK